MSKRILIVDDTIFMQTIISNILSTNGYKVCGTANNGQDSVNKYDALKPDLVTMDITMPYMDGITAVKTIRAKHPDANIIMCSAMGQQAMVIEAIRAGAKDFVVKPFQQDRVLEAVRKVLGE